MKILFVMDQYNEPTNGITTSAWGFERELKNRGHDVRVLACNTKGEGNYALPEKHVPLATYFAHKQGLLFAKPVVETIEEAIEWADVVHIQVPFTLSKKVKAIAQKMNKPITGAFHVQPENVTYNIGLSSSQCAVRTVYKYFHRTFYKGIPHLHCPSQFIANQLVENGYKAKLHVISNGINPKFKPLPDVKKPERLKDKFVITMVGRLSPEKRQDILIKGVANSKYADKMHVIFAGRGPKAKKYKKLADNYLPGQVDFVFVPQDELLEILNYSDLYVHAADVEIEAIACIEAFATGLVPIISDSKKSATPQFARNEKSLFTPRDYENLTEKIEYWYEHPEEKKEAEQYYIDYAKNFHIEISAEKMEKMFEEAISDHKKDNA